MGTTLIVLLRAAIAFVSILVVCRVLGRTQLSQMTFFEYVTGITIGAIAAGITIDLSVRPWPLYVGLLAWGGLTMATQYIALKSRWWGKMLDGEPVVVVQNGELLERNLGLVRVPVDELTSMLRDKGVFDIGRVEFAVFEPSGKLSVLKRSQHRPVTPADLDLPTAYEGMGIELVVDGEVMEQNLRRLHLNRAWLLHRLREQGIDSPEHVFLAVLDTKGQVYVDRYQDRVEHLVDMSDYPGPN